MFVVDKQVYGNQIQSVIVVDNNNISDEEIKNLKSTIKDFSNFRIVMNREIALTGPSLFEKICSEFPGVDVFIKVDDVEYDVNFNSSQVFSRPEMEKLMQSNDIVKKYGANLYLSGFSYGDDPLGRENKIPFSRVVIANSKMNNWVDRINNAKIDGKPLSPFEKYLYAYQIVTEFKYTEDQIFEARDISRILSSNFIVCAGYSAILSELCRRVGIVCKRQFIHTDESENEELKNVTINHECCILKLTDPKYDIDGFFIADPTLDSYDYAVEDGTTLTHALMAIDEYEKLNNGKQHIILDDNSSLSNYYFLRDAGVLPNDKIFAETVYKKEAVEDAVKYNYFDTKFDKFMEKSFNFLGDPKKCETFNLEPKEFQNIYLIDNAYTTEDIARNEALLSNLALKTFSTVDVNDVNSNEIKKFFFESLNKYMENNNLENNTENIKYVTQSLMDTAKTNTKVLEDSQLLYSLADYNDSNIIFNSNSQEKFRDIINTHYDKTPTIKNYMDALTNVYMASGGDKQSSIELADFMINASVWLADAYGWSKMGTTNVFAKEAELTKPIETLMAKKKEELTKTNGNDISGESAKTVVKNKNFEELKKLGVDLDIEDQILHSQKIRLCGYNLKVKLNDNKDKTLE